MSDEPFANVYHNATTGATPNPVMINPDQFDEEFVTIANDILQSSVELIRKLIGAHQGAFAIVVQGDWTTIRKYFSLSTKYGEWAEYATPATGYGIHGWLLQQNQSVRLTQSELEAHPAWRNFGREAGKHPPMRGWLAAPIVDSQGTNWGLAQLSDKYEGDFTEEDEQMFTSFVHVVARALEAQWNVRILKGQLQAQASQRASE